ncbi:MAG TPA: DUF3177 domain-containing protein [Planktothrix sp. UBA8407]|jgi:Protein of unknown function (DUF3177).|nr:DUF3177 domain-containing protein [Planktothrix sp. UBA8402]HAO11961.1 DUF3177 domain-containing protein [Planktothrix sp. UBA8407]HBK21265.1 DUF3177 domain-containing protein [Planktothrix sp. UBA10369]
MLNYLLAVESPWLQPLVWTDYRLAVIFALMIPLVILIWAFVQKAEAIQRLMMTYLRVASLLIISLYLMIAALPISFLTYIMARVLIPISLWFWVDLNEEVSEMPASGLKLIFTSWRWAVTVYNILGAIVLIPFVHCAFSHGQKELIGDATCRIWLDPAWLYKQTFSPNLTPQFLGFFALVGLAVYILYLGYFVFFKLGKQGRSAMG